MSNDALKTAIIARLSDLGLDEIKGFVETMEDEQFMVSTLLGVKIVHSANSAEAANINGAAFMDKDDKTFVAIVSALVREMSAMMRGQDGTIGMGTIPYNNPRLELLEDVVATLCVMLTPALSRDDDYEIFRSAYIHNLHLVADFKKLHREELGGFDDGEPQNSKEKSVDYVN